MQSGEDWTGASGMTKSPSVQIELTYQLTVATVYGVQGEKRGKIIVSA